MTEIRQNTREKHAMSGDFEPPEAVRELFRKSQEIECPPGVAPIPEMLKSGRFFPGGCGWLWRDSDSLPVGGAMIVGQDFSNEETYRWWRENENYERNSFKPAEDNLRELFTKVGLPMQKCFFTNFYTGLRKTKSMMGPFPGANDKKYVAACQEFFLRQIDTVRPRLIIPLGTKVPRLIAPLAKELHGWKKCRSSTKLDEAGAVHKANFNGHCAVVCWLIHPSMRNSNLRHRERNGESGDAVEKRLLRKAMRACKWPTAGD